MNRIAAYRLPHYPQKRTFRGPRWTSAFDPKQNFGQVGERSKANAYSGSPALRRASR